jgi:hypothetical protein
VPGSYRKINYALRPAKTIERKMLCEAFRRLYPFGKLETYRYIGFGSIYFSDFILFHRALGINNMLSIEKDEYARECFEFNKPYQCVTLDFRPSTSVLPGLDWDIRSIVWLDYEEQINGSILSDITSVCSHACSGSVILVSVNARPESEPDASKKQEYTSETGLPFDLDCYRLRCLKNQVLDYCLPPGISGKDLRGKGLAKVSRRLITSTISEVLSIRNSLNTDTQKVAYHQIFNFEYSDGPLMLTVGGVLVSKEDEEKLNTCSFGDINFVKQGEEAYSIRVPCLTPKEIRYLNAQLPFMASMSLDLPGVPPSDSKQYAELYRYFPVFTEAFFS